MIFDGDRDQIEPYLRELADLMGLKDWEIVVPDREPEKESSGADCVAYYGRKKAEIAFNSKWGDMKVEDFRCLCVHELIHCHTRPMEEPIHNIKSFVGEPAYNITYLSFSDALEYAVDAIATEWARTLPLPVTATTRKKVKA